jgi:hypothetical protein
LPTAETTARENDNVIKETIQQPTPRPSEAKASTVSTVLPKSILPEGPPKHSTMPEIKISTASPEVVGVDNEIKHQQEQVKRPGTLPLLGTSLTNRRASVYLQIAAVVSSPEDGSVSSDDVDSDEEENLQKPRKISSRRKSFMTWVNDKKKLFPSLRQVASKSKDEVRRQSFFSWVESREMEKQREKQKMELAILENESGLGDIIDSDLQPRVSNLKRSESLNIGPFATKARQIMHTLTFIRKEPLNVRLKKFYAKLEEVKRRDEMPTPALSRGGCRSVQGIGDANPCVK